MLATEVQDLRSNSNYEEIKHDWSVSEVMALFDLPFNDLLHTAHSIHRRFFDHNELQLSTLLNIKTGGCPEDCAYCPQSSRFNTGIEKMPLMELAEVVRAAEMAKAGGATRFCMGAAWRSPKEKDFDRVLKMVAAVNNLGLESCATLGMLTRDQAMRLKEHGLDFYNHNLDTSSDFYKTIISTRTYEDRLNTLSVVREAGINVCCGGIIGMGEETIDRAELLALLANMDRHPESVPINMLVKVEGTPLVDKQTLSPIEFARTIAVTRVLLPASYIRLSAGRDDMTDEMQALCFHAGANSVFFGERLLTTENPEKDRDLALFQQLGLKLKS